MSRSYKKPSVKEYKSCKLGKQIANRLLRRTCKKEDSIRNGKMYKKLYCSWNITDYKWVCWKQYKHIKNKEYWTEIEYNKYIEKCSRK